MKSFSTLLSLYLSKNFWYYINRNTKEALRFKRVWADIKKALMLQYFFRQQALSLFNTAPEVLNYYKAFSKNIRGQSTNPENNFFHLLTQFNRIVKNIQTISYIVEVRYTKKNTLIILSDSLGNTLDFFNAGNMGFKGKLKKRRHVVVGKLVSALTLNSKYYFDRQATVVAVHLLGVGKDKLFLTNLIKLNFVVGAVLNTGKFPYNGCRGKKIRRRKFSRTHGI